MKPQITRNPDGSISMTTPDGRTIRTRRQSAEQIAKTAEVINSYHAAFRNADQAADEPNDEDEA